jgi:hypothetical protein
MAMTLQDIRDFVRDHIDLEPVDLPNGVLDRFIREGSKRVERAESRWPFYEAAWTLQLSPGNRGPYSVATISEDINTIAALESSKGQLQWVGFDHYTLLNPRDREAQSRPWIFTEWAKELWFWPTPDSNYELIVRGYRKPEDWVSKGAGAMPDMPDDLHNFIAQWALSRAYAQQEDPEMATLYERQAINELQVFRQAIAESGHYRPMVLGGRPSRVPFPQRLAFSWEV